MCPANQIVQGIGLVESGIDRIMISKAIHKLLSGRRHNSLFQTLLRKYLGLFNIIYFCGTCCIVYAAKMNT